MLSTDSAASYNSPGQINKCQTAKGNQTKLSFNADADAYAVHVDVEPKKQL